MESMLNIKDKLSVVITTYKRSKQLCRTLDFLENSPLKDCRITILNNQSPDDTIEAFKPYASKFPNIQMVTHPVNLGNGNANYVHSINYCNTEYIWILSDDDVYDFSAFDDVAEEIMKGRADVIHVGAHDDGEWNWGVYDTPKNLVKKGYRFFKYSSFWPCTIYKYSYMVRYIRDAYDYIHFWYSHFPALAAAYENDVPVYVSKRRVVKAVVGEQTYSYYIPVRGFVISSSYLSDNASKRAICQAAFDNNHSLWYNAMDYLYRYRAEDDIVLVRDVLCKILSPIERLAMRVCFLPYVVYRECILLSRRIKNRKKGT